jgi:hypothetical protein
MLDNNKLLDQILLFVLMVGHNIYFENIIFERGNIIYKKERKKERKKFIYTIYLRFKICKF